VPISGAKANVRLMEQDKIIPMYPGPVPVFSWPNGEQVEEISGFVTSDASGYGIKHVDRNVVMLGERVFAHPAVDGYILKVGDDYYLLNSDGRMCSSRKWMVSEDGISLVSSEVSSRFMDNRFKIGLEDPLIRLDGNPVYYYRITGGKVGYDPKRQSHVVYLPAGNYRVLVGFDKKNLITVLDVEYNKNTSVLSKYRDFSDSWGGFINEVNSFKWGGHQIYIGQEQSDPKMFIVSEGIKLPIEPIPFARQLKFGTKFASDNYYSFSDAGVIWLFPNLGGIISCNPNNPRQIGFKYTHDDIEVFGRSENENGIASCPLLFRMPNVQDCAISWVKAQGGLNPSVMDECNISVNRRYSGLYSETTSESWEKYWNMIGFSKSWDTQSGEAARYVKINPGYLVYAERHFGVGRVCAYRLSPDNDLAGLVNKSDIAPSDIQLNILVTVKNTEGREQELKGTIRLGNSGKVIITDCHGNKLEGDTLSMDNEHPERGVMLVTRYFYGEQKSLVPFTTPFKNSYYVFQSLVTGCKALAPNKDNIGCFMPPESILHDQGSRPYLTTPSGDVISALGEVGPRKRIPETLSYSDPIEGGVVVSSESFFMQRDYDVKAP
jgi:hypothetical protein